MDFGNNPFLASLEGEIEFTKYTYKKHYNAFGVNYQIQSRYNKLKEADYYKLIGKWKEIHDDWQHGITTYYTKRFPIGHFYTPMGIQNIKYPYISKKTSALTMLQIFKPVLV